jgi:hypothetical protein
LASVAIRSCLAVNKYSGKTSAKVPPGKDT